MRPQAGWQTDLLFAEVRQHNATLSDLAWGQRIRWLKLLTVLHLSSTITKAHKDVEVTHKLQQGVIHKLDLAKMRMACIHTCIQTHERWNAIFIMGIQTSEELIQKWFSSWWVIWELSIEDFPIKWVFIQQEMEMWGFSQKEGENGRQVSPWIFFYTVPWMSLVLWFGYPCVFMCSVSLSSPTSTDGSTKSVPP